MRHSEHTKCETLSLSLPFCTRETHTRVGERTHAEDTRGVAAAAAAAATAAFSSFPGCHEQKKILAAFDSCRVWAKERERE